MAVTVINTGNLSNIKIFEIGDDWEIFADRLDQYLKANKVEDDRKASVLITSISEETYKVLKNVCDPGKPCEKSYDVLKDLLESQFKPKVSLYRRRVHFDILRQNNETVNEWYVKVKKVAAECEFGASLSERVKDKFVVGMKPGPVLDRLCEEKPTKELRDLLNIALAKEAVLKESRGVEIHRIQKVKEYRKLQQVADTKKKEERGKESIASSEQRTVCFYCNRGNHDFKKCKFRKYTCSKCKKKGHIAAACKAKIDKNYCNENVLDDQDVEMFNVDIFNIKSDGDEYVNPVSIDILINDKPVRMEVDTGAGLSCLPYDLYKKHFSAVELEPTRVILKYYDGPLVYPKGKIKADVTINDCTYPFSFIIVEGARKSLMGRDIWTRFGLTLTGNQVYFNGEKIRKSKNKLINEIDHMGINKNYPADLEPLIKKFTNIFKCEIGTYKDEKIKLEVEEGISPIFKKPHPIPFAFRDKVNKELEKLEKEGVIEKIPSSLWGTPLVPVMKANGVDIRLCANYKITINKYLKDFNHPLPRIEDIFAALQGGQKYTKLDFLNAYNQLVLDDETSKLLAWSTPNGTYWVKRLP